jgi:hypothetical protein
MGPWQCCHLHEFTFARPSVESHHILTPPSHDILKISSSSLYDDEPVWSNIPGMPTRTNVHKEKEETLLLKDIYNPAGCLRSVITPNDQVFPLYYLYDFGVSLLVSPAEQSLD